MTATDTTPAADTTTTDVRDLMARAVELTTSVVATVRPDHLALPTPCTDMDVRTLLVHLNEVLDRLACLGRGEPAFPVAERIAPTDDAVLATWLTAAAEQQQAWADASVLDTPMFLPWAQCDGREMLQGYLGELSTHTWDLARSIGVDIAWDDEVLAAGLATTQSWLPAEGRAERFAEIAARIGGGGEVRMPYGMAVPVSTEAPLIDQLVSHQGRDPRWTA